ncbi:MAG: LacI family DNA-binding transcriptional regulator [Faecalibacterium sp.]|nr:LacI family DNA-binding transcriptional regulator [Faecalibacterium sp.]
MAMNDAEHKVMNLSQIAAELGVSKTTVSRAISGKGRVSEETRAKVQAYIRIHNYRPNLVARGLAQNKTYNVALVIPRHFQQLDLAFLRRTMGAVYELATQNDYDVLLSMVSERDTSPLRRLLDNHKIDGAILTRTIMNDPLIPLLKEYSLPFVAIGRPQPPDDQVMSVDNDQVGGARELTTLLLMKGMRRIAILGGTLLYTVNQSRVQGFRQAYAQMNLPVEENLVYLELESDSQRINALEKALTFGPDCILCMDEEVASLVMRTLRQRGIKVPEQIKVASLYDSPELVNMVPQVTAVQYDAFQLGNMAMQQLLATMEGTEVERRLELGFQVILRDSTKT